MYEVHIGQEVRLGLRDRVRYDRFGEDEVRVSRPRCGDRLRRIDESENASVRDAPFPATGLLHMALHQPEQRRCTFGAARSIASRPR
ncbi:hypothetical protein BJF85_14625 [Saccharomonospora sp. CUA-673]|nr:hypothetical protein BJF85_14625 [Saccharomonospora sp. CUA-673]